jgi:D-apionolactonase
MITGAFHLNGASKASPAPVPLKAGPLEMIFEPETAFLRQVRLGDHEIVRAVYGAIRDRNWDTITPEIAKLDLQTAADNFQVQFEAHCQRGEIDFLWNGRIKGNPDGQVAFEFEGVARSSFWRNRIGLCVLHPLQECVGKPCSILHADGTVEESVFPRFISPHQPFKEIRAITHQPAPGVKIEVRFEGEVFEMEDQRNWTDASFKTYSTPLALPFPVEIKAGTRISQSVIISFPAAPRKILPVLRGRPPQVSIATTPVWAKPPLGLCQPEGNPSLSSRELALLEALRLSHLRADLHPGQEGWQLELHRSAENSRALNLPLHLALFLTGNPEEELRELRQELDRSKPRAGLFLIFDEKAKVTPIGHLRLAREILAGYSPNILFAAGTNAYFAELNRERPPASLNALPCFSLNPQVHAFDELSLIENLEAQPHTIQGAQQFTPLPAVVSPITLRPRFNPNATAAQEEPSGDLPPSVDPRQLSLLGAGWTLGSLSRLFTVAPQIHSLTYYQTSGWQGLMETEAGSPLPEKFPSLPGSVFPVYHLFADMAGFDRLCLSQSSHPQQVEALTLLDPAGKRRILAANLTIQPLAVKIKTGMCQGKVRYLDSHSLEQALLAPAEFRAAEGASLQAEAGKMELNLEPFALARLDITA